MGWGEISQDVAKAALEGSLHTASLYVADELIAFGRVIGDGALNFYIQDVMVAPDYRGQGLGRRVMQALLDDVSESAPAGATVGLMSAKGKDAFYTAFGFETRPNPVSGAGMTLIL
ncbi:MAG: GNAT family N-acetyltransferase [Litorimonas sp.]